jgi:hypothetical protein
MKPQTKKILASATLAFASLFSGGAANAVCDTPANFGAIEYSTTAGGGTTFYITEIKAVLPATALFFFAAAGSTFHATLSDAQAAGQIVSVRGNAVTCPTTGTFRNGGTVTSVQRYDQ